MNRKLHPTADDLRRALRRVADPNKAALYRRFFKTGKGQYGEGDRFLGIVVPKQREIAKQFRGVSLSVASSLLKSPYHEERLTSLLILMDRYRRGDEAEQARIVTLYLQRLDAVNNWDLVDISAPRMLGVHLLTRSRKPLYRLVVSPNLWRRRIALLATFAFIARNDFRDTLAMCKILLHDREDLIHKAVGWALREVGKRDRRVLEKFLDDHGASMPRTSLRYAIERFSDTERRRLLKTTKTKTAKKGRK